MTSSSDLQKQMAALQAEFEKQKLAESKIDPQFKEVQAELKLAQAKAVALTKKMEHISRPDYGEIKKEETRVQVVNLMKDCWNLNDMVEKEKTKLDAAWLAPTKATQVEFVSQLNSVISSMFYTLTVLCSSQDWGEHTKNEIVQLEEVSRKRKKDFKEDVFEPIKEADVCTCRKNKTNNSSCAKRCPCKKAGRRCQTACHCTDGSCINPFGCVPKTYAGKPIRPASSAGSAVRGPEPHYASKFVFSLIGF
jgi:hypothetical protein